MLLQEAMLNPGELTCVYICTCFHPTNSNKISDHLLLCSAIIPATRPLTRAELSKKFRDHFGYTLDIGPSGIPHKDAGQGLFLSGQANAGAVLAIYPGVIYSPAYYRYIPGYPRIDVCNNYLITRYDGTIIDAKPWCFGGETRE